MKIQNLKLQNKTILAPLENFSNHAFHIICHRYDAALVFTQMYHINGILNDLEKFQGEFELYPEEHPIIIQLIGSDHNVMARAMDLLESYEFDGYDLNLGCPSTDAIKCGFGGYLLKYPDKIRPLLSAMLNATNKSVSAKIRSGFNYFDMNAPKIAKIIEDEGANFITIHGRTVKQMYKGENNLALIKECKEKVLIPVVGNGDIIDGASAKNMLDKTKCDLLMIGRAAIGYPRIFLEINRFLSGKKVPPVTEKGYLKILHEYLLLLQKTYPSKDFSFYKSRLIQFIRPKSCEKGFKEKLQAQESFGDLEKLLTIDEE